MVRGSPVRIQYNLPIHFDYNNHQNQKSPEAAKYWSKRGKKNFMRIYLNEYQKNINECNCWYNFIILNYNSLTTKELDFDELFNKQTCKLYQDIPVRPNRTGQCKYAKDIFFYQT